MSILTAETIREAVAAADSVDVNSTNNRKLVELFRLFEELGIPSMILMNHLAQQHVESDFPDALVVAESKSRWLIYRMIQNGSESEPVTAGLDTAFQFKTQNGWESWAKLERLNRELTPTEIWVYWYQKLYDLLVVPEDKTIEMSWQVSLNITNGHSRDFTTWIMVRTNPIDKELFDQYFDEAVEKGYLYGSNSRMRMIEMLIKSMSMQQIAVVPHEIVKNGDDIEPYFMEASDENVLDIVRRSIISSVPWAGLALEKPKKNHRVIWEASVVEAPQSTDQDLALVA